MEQKRRDGREAKHQPSTVQDAAQTMEVFQYIKLRHGISCFGPFLLSISQCPHSVMVSLPLMLRGQPGKDYHYYMSILKIRQLDQLQIVRAATKGRQETNLDSRSGLRFGL